MLLLLSVLCEKTERLLQDLIRSFCFTQFFLKFHDPAIFLRNRFNFMPAANKRVQASIFSDLAPICQRVILGIVNFSAV